MATGNYPFGGNAPGFTTCEILLINLQISVSGGWTSTYLDGSGSYTGYESIAAFISELQSGELGDPDSPLPTFAPGDAPPDILVRMPCYVVIVVSSSDQPSICFQPTPMTTGTDCSGKYYDLTEPYNDGDGKPRVLYFAVPVVAVYTTNVVDPYTMNVEYTSGGTVITHSIDPCIKNRGWHPG